MTGEKYDPFELLVIKEIIEWPQGTFFSIWIRKVRVVAKILKEMNNFITQDTTHTQKEYYKYFIMAHWPENKTRITGQPTISAYYSNL